MLLPLPLFSLFGPNFLPTYLFDAPPFPPPAHRHSTISANNVVFGGVTIVSLLLALFFVVSFVSVQSPGWPGEPDADLFDSFSTPPIPVNTETHRRALICCPIVLLSPLSLHFLTCSQRSRRLAVTLNSELVTGKNAY